MCCAIILQSVGKIGWVHLTNQRGTHSLECAREGREGPAPTRGDTWTRIRAGGRATRRRCSASFGGPQLSLSSLAYALVVLRFCDFAGLLLLS